MSDPGDFEGFDDDEPPAVTDDSPELPPVDAPPMRRRRRPLMGQLIARMGPAARATTRPADSEKALQARARQAEARRLLEGGKNKGAQRGYGLTPAERPAKP